MTPEQFAEIKNRKVPHGPNAVRTLVADRDALLAEVEQLKAERSKAAAWEVHLAENLHYAQLDGAGAAAEVERLTSELSVAFGPGLYLDIQKVLDEALGTHEADGAGAGIAADVAVLAERKRTAETEVKRLRTALKDAADQMAASDSDQAKATIELYQTKARIRELLASMRAAVSSGDHATLAFNIGQIAVHVDVEVDAR